MDKVKDDRYIIATILTSNLAEDNVWEHTNINLFLIGRDDAKFDEHYSLVEDGVNINVTMHPRKRYQQTPRRWVTGE